MNQPTPVGTSSVPRYLLMGVCAALLVAPVFFASQIMLHILGRPEWNVFGDEGQNLLAHTPVFSLVAPFIRPPILILCLILAARGSSWIVPTFLIGTIIHLFSWLSILSNSYFTLPTGYITLALEAVGIYLLVRYPTLRGQKPGAMRRSR